MLIILSILSVTNVIIGAVQQRKREIQVYSSVGLSPTGIFLIFFSESLAYALIGSVIGYLLGFVMNKLSLMSGLLPISFTFNFSGSFIVISLSAIIFTCLVAAVYPSLIAAKILTPSLQYKWRLGEKPIEDQWGISLPFRLSSLESLGFLRFLEEYYSGIGSMKPGFRVYTASLNPESLRLSLNMRLEPAELGINQDVQIIAVPEKEKERYVIHLLITRKSGNYDMWVSRNYHFIDDLRKQILIWRTLSPIERRRYWERKG